MACVLDSEGFDSQEPGGVLRDGISSLHASGWGVRVQGAQGPKDLTEPTTSKHFIPKARVVRVSVSMASGGWLCDGWSWPCFANSCSSTFGFGSSGLVLRLRVQQVCILPAPCSDVCAAGLSLPARASGPDAKYLVARGV